MMISVELRLFLQSYLDWIHQGAVENFPHSRSKGLCGNYSGRIAELTKLLERDFGITFTPFGSDYGIRSTTRTQHLCPNRINWVKRIVSSE